MSSLKTYINESVSRGNKKYGNVYPFSDRMKYLEWIQTLKSFGYNVTSGMLPKDGTAVTYQSRFSKNYYIDILTEDKYFRVVFNGSGSFLSITGKDRDDSGDLQTTTVEELNAEFMGHVHSLKESVSHGRKNKTITVEGLTYRSSAYEFVQAAEVSGMVQKATGKSPTDDGMKEFLRYSESCSKDSELQFMTFDMGQIMMFGIPGTYIGFIVYFDKPGTEGTVEAIELVRLKMLPHRKIRRNPVWVVLDEDYAATEKNRGAVEYYIGKIKSIMLNETD